MQRRQRNVAFTLLELLVAVIVISILASMAMVGYRGYQDRVAIMVDETNQKILQIAVRMQAIDTGSIAGSLARVNPEYLDRAYAKYMEGKPTYTMLAYAKEVLGVPVAEAVPLQIRYLTGQGDLRRLLTCPVGPTFPAYGVNPDVSCAGVAWMLRPVNQGVPLIIEIGGNEQPADCNDVRNPPDNPELAKPASLALRHKNGTLRVVTSVTGIPCVQLSDGTVNCKEIPSGGGGTPPQKPPPPGG